MIISLQSYPESRFWVSLTETNRPLSTEGRLLTAIHNAIIASIPSDKKDANKKREAMIPQPVSSHKKPKPGFTKEEAEKNFAKIFGGVEEELSEEGLEDGTE